jgi:hypothetical protein
LLNPTLVVGNCHDLAWQGSGNEAGGCGTRIASPGFGPRKSEYRRLAGRDRRYIKGQKYTLL